MQARNRSSCSFAQQPSQVIPLKRIRFWLICLFFRLWVFAIATVSSGCKSCSTRLTLSAPEQQQRTFEVAPRRGVLYDRNLRELAMTVQVDSIYADPARSPTRKPQPMRSLPSSTPIPQTRTPPRARLLRVLPPGTTSRGSRGAFAPKLRRAFVRSI